MFPTLVHKPLLCEFSQEIVGKQHLLDRHVLPEAEQRQLAA